MKSHSNRIFSGVRLGITLLTLVTLLLGGTGVAFAEGTKPHPAECFKTTDPVLEISGVLAGYGTGAVTVNGIAVTLDENTRVDDGVADGLLVKVIAVVKDSVLVAVRVEVEAEAISGMFELHGVVDSIGDGVIVVNGQTISLAEGLTLDAAIQAGVLVEVRGVTENGALIAQTVELRERDREREQEQEQEGGPQYHSGDPEHELFGAISSYDGTSLVINGVTVVISADTVVDGTLAVDSVVKVEGTLQEDGTFLASEIEVLERDGQEPGGTETNPEHPSVNPLPPGPGQNPNPEAGNNWHPNVDDNDNEDGEGNEDGRP